MTTTHFLIDDPERIATGKELRLGATGSASAVLNFTEPTDTGRASGTRILSLDAAPGLLSQNDKRFARFNIVVASTGEDDRTACFEELEERLQR